MSEDVIRRYNGARPIQAPAQLLADAIREVEVLREENARLSSDATLLRELLEDVFAQWDGDWPEELVARVKAAISGERAIGGPLATSSRRRS